MDIYERLNKIFRDVFDDDELQLDDEMTSNDVAGWDSLSHINLITMIESDFRVNFSQKELLVFKKVGDLKKCLEQKLQ